MKKLLGKYSDIHSDPILGAYYYLILKNSIELYYLKDNKVVIYNTLPNTGNDILISNDNLIKNRVYPYNRNALIICIGNTNYVYYSNEYVDLLQTQRVWNNGVLDSNLLKDYIIPEDFDLYKNLINKNDLSISKIDELFTTYPYIEVGSNSIYRIQAILLDLVNNKKYNINKCYAFDNFIVYDNGLKYEVYPYELQYHYNNFSKPIIYDKIDRRIIYSSPSIIVYNGELYDISSGNKQTYDLNNIYIFRGNFI